MMTNTSTSLSRPTSPPLLFSRYISNYYKIFGSFRLASAKSKLLGFFSMIHNILNFNMCTLDAARKYIIPFGHSPNPSPVLRLQGKRCIFGQCSPSPARSPEARLTYRPVTAEQRFPNDSLHALKYCGKPTTQSRRML